MALYPSDEPVESMVEVGDAIGLVGLAVISALGLRMRGHPHLGRFVSGEQRLIVTLQVL
jgi:hypothetical protein